MPSLNPVLAVKIENIVHAPPQTGLSRADIVYVLPVEGGLSRFLAIFSAFLRRVAALPAVRLPGRVRAGRRPQAGEGGAIRIRA